MSPRFLVTGASGLLGPYLLEAVGRVGGVVGTGLHHSEHPCDLTDRDAVAALLDRVAPTHVIHAAAFADVDGCERDRDHAEAANHLAVANLADVLAPTARLIAISTDQVYPDTPGPHREGTEAPVNVYGRSKLAGERAALRRAGSLVLRTNFFGPSRTANRQSLSDFVILNLRAHRAIMLFDDIRFSPLHMLTVAEWTVAAAMTDLSGAYNLGSRDGQSKAEFGLAVARRHGLSTDTVRVLASSELPLRAPRAHDFRMATARIEAALGRRAPTLAAEIDRLHEAPP